MILCISGSSPVISKSIQIRFWSLKDIMVRL
ncbi:Uncharacterised protein [Vibrio cholerae]|nr:Uncharacterised protein [Vibrio cholerae]